MKWTAQIHEDLLISVFNVTKLSGEQVRTVLADMRARGYDISDRALTYVFDFLFLCPHTFLLSTCVTPVALYLFAIAHSFSSYLFSPPPLTAVLFFTLP